MALQAANKMLVIAGKIEIEMVSLLITLLHVLMLILPNF
jgi:hypothetical protein